MDTCSPMMFFACLSVFRHPHLGAMNPPKKSAYFLQSAFEKWTGSSPVSKRLKRRLRLAYIMAVGP